MPNENQQQLPNNTKQIGAIDKNFKLYIEDYAYTYLKQYGMSKAQKEGACILLGNGTRINGEKVLFISAAIAIKFLHNKNGIEQLTEKSWQYIKKELDLYFPTQRVVGLAYFKPNFEDESSVEAELEKHFKDNTDRGLDVLFIMNALEKTDSFFALGTDKKVLKRIDGYYIYYDKNEAMHEYMLDNPLPKPFNDESKERAISNRLEAIRIKTTKKEEKKLNEQKKLINMLSYLSFVLFMVCLVMGAGLIQNDERIADIEYRIIKLQDTLGDSQSVFAPVENTTEVTTAQLTTITTTTQATTQATTKKQEEKKKQVYYRVEQGDNLTLINRKFYGDENRIAEIMALNDITDGNQIYYGRQLLMP